MLAPLEREFSLLRNATNVLSEFQEMVVSIVSWSLPFFANSHSDDPLPIQILLY